MSKKETTRKNRVWTEKDTKFITENYASLGPTACAKKLHAPRPTVVHYAQKLGLTRQAERPWTDDELRTLEQNANEELSILRTLLPDRTDAAIYAKKCALERRGTVTLKKREFPWRKKSVRQKFLKLYNEGLNDAEIAQRLGPNFSVPSVRHYRTTKAKLPRAKKTAVQPWTEEQTALLMQVENKNDIKALAESLGRSESSVRRKYYRLRAKTTQINADDTGDPPCQEN